MPTSKKYQDVIRQRLRDFIGVEGFLETTFIQTCGLANGWWSAQGLPAGTSLQKIKRRFPRLNMEWLFTGDGNMYVGFDEHQHVRPLQAEGANQVSDITTTDVNVTQPPKSEATTSEAHKSEATISPQSEASRASALPSEATITLPREVYNLLLQQLRQKDNTITSLLQVMQHPVTPPSVTPTNKVTPQQTNNQTETKSK